MLATALGAPSARHRPANAGRSPKLVSPGKLAAVQLAEEQRNRANNTMSFAGRSVPFLILLIGAAGFALAVDAEVAGETPGANAPGSAEVAAYGEGGVSFTNDVIPALTRLGCNQGTCHGSAGGKGGFSLSLRGFAPELDYLAIGRDAQGRRVDLAHPEASLLLLKPTAAISHQGGRVLDPASDAYGILLRWLRQGAPQPSDDEPTVVSLMAEPEAATWEIGHQTQFVIHARFADGSQRDVTRWALYDTGDSMVAAVDANGRATARGPGITAVSAGYQGRVVAVEVAVPFSPGDPDRDYARLPRANYIDELIIDQWRKLGLWPSSPCDDHQFLRRVSLDLTGTLPTVETIRAFAADGDPLKRQSLIHELLESPRFAECWAQRWGDVLRVSREWIGEKSIWVMQHYLHDVLQRNVPWDVVVRELIGGRGDSSAEGPPNFYRLQKVFNEPELWPLVAAETTAQTFLGIRMQCARCHNHPLDQWTQNDYYALANFFAQVAVKVEAPDRVVVYDASAGDLLHPRLGRPMPPRPPGGPAMPADSSLSRREFLAAWVTSPENPRLARATANRLWKQFMRVGLVEPVDDLRASNLATNAALLEALARDLVEHHYDLKHLMRQILRSRAYAVSATPTDENLRDQRFYSHAILRRMTAEQLLDSVDAVTCVPAKFSGLPAGLRAQQLPDTRVASAFLDKFGRPLRRIASCECERIQEPNLGQALELMHGEELNDRLTAADSSVDRFLAAGLDDAAIIEQLYYSCLSRSPAPDERSALLAELAATVDGAEHAGLAPRREFFQDLLWAIINSKEFVYF